LALAIPFPSLLLSPALLLRGAPIQPSRLWSLRRRNALLCNTKVISPSMLGPLDRHLRSSNPPSPSVSSQ